jgi:hypothetical protein
MGQHPNPNPDNDEDHLEALGTPFYQGTGLSVRALTAEELQQFLDAHADQPTEPLGSGWAALDRPGHPLTGPRTLREPNLRHPNPSRGSRPSTPPPALAIPAAPPAPGTGASAPPSWPPGPAA